MPTVIVTRPYDDACEAALVLKQYGVNALKAPMFDIVPNVSRFVSIMASMRYQAILATSRHAVRFIAEDIKDKSVLLFAVGAKTADYALARGFTQVVQANGDVSSLVSMVQSHCDVNNGALFYPCGQVVRHDLQAALPNYTVAPLVVYDTISTGVLPSQVSMAIESQMIDGVMLCSQRTAELWVKQVKKYNYMMLLHAIPVYCFSVDIADYMKTQGFDTLLVSPQYKMQSFLAFIAKKVSMHLSD